MADKHVCFSAHMSYSDYQIEFLSLLTPAHRERVLQLWGAEIFHNSGYELLSIEMMCWVLQEWLRSSFGWDTCASWETFPAPSMRVDMWLSVDMKHCGYAVYSYICAPISHESVLDLDSKYNMSNTTIVPPSTILPSNMRGLCVVLFGTEPLVLF